MSKSTLTPTEIQALAAAAGVAAPAAPAAAQVTQTEGEKDGDAAPAAAAAPAAPAAAAAAPAAAPSAIEVLTQQLTASAGQLAQAQVQLNTANGRIETMQKTIDSLSAVVSAAVSNMQVALGATASDFSKLSAEQLLAEHASTAEKFKASFKTGGVAAVTPSQTDEKPVVDANHLARVQATRFNTK